MSNAPLTRKSSPRISAHVPRTPWHWAHLKTVKSSTSFGMSIRMAPQDTHSSLRLMSSFGTRPNLAKLVVIPPNPRDIYPGAWNRVVSQESETYLTIHIFL